MIWEPSSELQREIDDYRCAPRYRGLPDTTAYARALDGRQIPEEDVVVGEPDPADEALKDGRELPERFQASFAALPDEIKLHVALRFRKIRHFYGV